MAGEGAKINLPLQPLTVTECSVCGCMIPVADRPPLTQIECPDCKSNETVPGRFGPFLIMGIIGTGGMGGVYRAKDETLGRLVAIKVVLPSVASNTDFLETFKREAQSAAKLNHPHIAQIYSFGQHAGQPYIVMELVDGKRFSEMFGENEPLSQEKVIKIGLEIAEGLQAADEIGLIHGDIKPENILLNEKNEAKLIDFGIASYAQKSGENGIWGTPYYIAPEKIQRMKVDARSDIYCLGGTLYHALTGKPPFDGVTPVDVVKSRLNNDPVPPREINSRIDPAVENIIMRMLERDPSRRYPNYGSLINDLKRAFSNVRSQQKGPRATVARNKKVIFTKKRTTNISDTAATSSPSADEPKTGKKTYKRVKASSDTSSAVAKHLEERKAAAAQAGKTEKKKGWWVKRFLIFLVIALIAGSAAGIYYLIDKNQKKKAALIEAYNLGKRKKDAAEILKEINGTGLKIDEMAGSAKALAATVSNSVFEVLNEAMVYELEPKPKVQKKEEAPPPDKADKKEVKEKSGEKPPVDDAELKAQKAEAEAKAAKEALDRGIPAGVSEELYKKLSGQKEDPKSKPATGQEPDPAPEQAQEQEQNVQPEPEAGAVKADDPEIKKSAVATIRQVQELLNETFRAHRTLEKAANLAANIDKAETIEATSEPFNELKIEGNTLKDHHKNIVEKLEAVKKSAQDVERLRKEDVKRRESEKLAQEEEERLRLEREEKARKEEARQQQIAKQIERVKALRTENLSMVKEYRFKEILDKVLAEKKYFDTQEGKEEYNTLVERYMHLYRLKKILIQHINLYPFKWGWGTGTSSIDILSATSENITLKTRNVPWEDVNLVQMIKIIKHYADRATYRQEQGAPTPQFTMPQLSAKPNEPWMQASFIRILGEFNMAAAIFCVETGGSRGRTMADDFARQATALCSDLEDDILKLVTIPEEAEGSEQPQKE